MLLLCLPQAIYIKRTSIRLPEASGQQFSVNNDKAKFKLLHIGESTVAGVGVNTLEEGFSANIANSLGQIVQHPIAWQMLGQNGIKLKGLNELLAQQLNPADDQFDLAIVTMGVNDSTKFTSIKQWQIQIDQSINQLKHYTHGPIFFTQVPPLAQFPALPALLKYLLGLRSIIMDLALKAKCCEHKNVYHLRSTLKVDKEMMAIDGYHPSKLGYQHWAKQISGPIYSALQKHKTL